MAARKSGRAGGQKARPAARRTDAFAFLNEAIPQVLVTETALLKVEVEDSYRRLLAGLRNFYHRSRRKLQMPKEGKTAERLCELVDWASKDIQELGLDLCTKKIDDYSELRFVLWRNVSCLDERVFVFYLSPIDTLPKPMGDLYRRYIKFVATSIGVGFMPNANDNYDIDMLINSTLDNYEEDDQEDPDYMKFVNIAKDYDAGDIYHTFESVRDLPDEEANDLKRDLRKFRRKTKDADLRELCDVLLEGMDVLPYMYIGSYDFNPYDDESLNDANEGYIDITSTVAFLYSSHDGMEDMLIDAINNDCYCGLVCAGWNKYLYLDLGYESSDYERLMACDVIERRFCDWVTKYCNVIEKYDKYGTDGSSEGKA